MSLIHLLHEKALSKRGYSWTGKLISSLLLTLTHTYPLENKFTNPDEWSSEGMLNGQSQFLHIDDRFIRVSKESSPPLGEALQSRRDQGLSKFHYYSLLQNNICYRLPGTFPTPKKWSLPCVSSRNWLNLLCLRWRTCYNLVCSSSSIRPLNFIVVRYCERRCLARWFLQVLTLIRLRE